LCFLNKTFQRIRNAIHKNVVYFIYSRRKLTAKSKTFCSIVFNLQCGCDETENPLTFSSLLSPILYALPAGLVAVTKRPYNVIDEIFFKKD
jgi:hypothetical protein